MGLFSKKVNYPELSEEHPAAEQIESIKAPLEKLVGQVSDPLEVVPADNHGYVFIGKPPKKFGIALLEEGSFKITSPLAKANFVFPLYSTYLAVISMVSPCLTRTLP